MKKVRLTLGPCSFSGEIFPIYEFHIAKEVRRKYQFDDELFSINGNVVLADFRAVRLFVQKLNAGREPVDRVGSGQVNAAGLIDEIYHYLFRVYEVQVNPGVFKKALDHLTEALGDDGVRRLIFDFVSLFPPREVYKSGIGIYDYLNSFTGGRSNNEISLEEMILLFIANFNPANRKLIELFDENYFTDKQIYKKAIGELDRFFRNEKKFGPGSHDMFTLLKLPIINHPDNLEAQLDFIRLNYGVLIDEKFLKRILTGKDLIREDYTFEGFGGGGGTPTIVPKYKGELGDADYLMLGKSGYKYALNSSKDYEEQERFTNDTDWMPRVVLIAKNTYVWLDQLSKKYNRPIKTLNEIPDEELDRLAGWNFNGLWLIGIWERSSASKKIKHVMGNIDAVSSAYSLYDYQIAHDLGGDEAYSNLNERARARGIRLASDMVPNHTGIFSRWVLEHPDYFIQSPYPPFPGYHFTGPDLSEDSSVRIRVEDGYWNRSDASVVFERLDNRTNEFRYIYHGNDGTLMPWNDTAQLNMLRPEVREAVIQKIFEVARKFSIIRFDAAMTLAKKHFSRLWYPEPGKGGDIPSRSDHAMTREEFDKAFPVEFWREVVDRINSEMPETLLLAEAFWLMEGYFVRTLGMHRVYNSAFMHMMMKEENAKYRDLISNTLEFEPEILKRYVNFMSNPDEETAIRQFGTGDKYFGIAMLMVTLPGLPMFAHGQVEGYTEKYGMEYQRAYYNETPNHWLVERHERELFPLMKKRYLFSQVRNFWLFDLVDSYGNVNENVFAYTNSEYGERSLVVYNNKYESASGKIARSSPKLVSSGESEKKIETKSLVEALGINPSQNLFYIFREHNTGLEYIRSGRTLDENGFHIELGAFKYAVYLDWREFYDVNGDWANLAWHLGNNGVPNVQRAFSEMKLSPVHAAFESMFDGESIDGFIKTCVLEKTGETEKDKISFIYEKFSGLLNEIINYFRIEVPIEPIIASFEEELVAVRKLNFMLDREFNLDKNPQYKEYHHVIQVSRDTNYHDNSIIFMLWLIISNISGLFRDTGMINKENYSGELLLDLPVRKILRLLGRGEQEISHSINLLNIFRSYFKEIVNLFPEKAEDQIPELQRETLENRLSALLDRESVGLYLGINEYENVWYYSKENFEEFIEWSFTLSCLEILKAEAGIEGADLFEDVVRKFKLSFLHLKELLLASVKAEYKLEKLKELLEETKAFIN